MILPTLSKLWTVGLRSKGGPGGPPLHLSRAETRWSPVVVVVELRRQTVCYVRVCRRQLWSVGQAIELVLTVQQHRTIDIHDRGPVDARTHEPVQLRAHKLSGQVEEWIARHLLLAVNR